MKNSRYVDGGDDIGEDDGKNDKAKGDFNEED